MKMLSFKNISKQRNTGKMIELHKQNSRVEVLPFRYIEIKSSFHF